MNTNAATNSQTAATNFVTEYTSVGNTLVPLSRPVPSRLVGVWAHPDDEAYLSAALMARVIEAGGHVTVITATRGEKGTSDPSLFDSDGFGRQREDELRASLAELGVHDVRLLGLRDGECDYADDESAVRSIVDVILDVEPDTLVTFGPDGMTGHADHQAVSRWTTEAWRRTGIPDLYYAAVSQEFVGRFAEIHDEIGLYDETPGGAPVVSRRRTAMECTLAGEELARKRRALAAHGSQTAGLAEMMGEELYTSWVAEEIFRRPTWSEARECPTPSWMHQQVREAVAA